MDYAYEKYSDDYPRTVSLYLYNKNNQNGNISSDNDDVPNWDDIIQKGSSLRFTFKDHSSDEYNFCINDCTIGTLLKKTFTSCKSINLYYYVSCENNKYDIFLNGFLKCDGYTKQQRQESFQQYKNENNPLRIVLSTIEISYSDSILRAFFLDTKQKCVRDYNHEKVEQIKCLVTNTMKQKLNLEVPLSPLRENFSPEEKKILGLQRLQEKHNNKKKWETTQYNNKKQNLQQHHNTSIKGLAEQEAKLILSINTANEKIKDLEQKQYEEKNSTYQERLDKLNKQVQDGTVKDVDAGKMRASLESILQKTIKDLQNRIEIEQKLISFIEKKIDEIEQRRQNVEKEFTERQQQLETEFKEKLQQLETEFKKREKEIQDGTEKISSQKKSLEQNHNNTRPMQPSHWLKKPSMILLPIAALIGILLLILTSTTTHSS